MAYNENEYQYANISTGTTTQVATGRGVLHSIVVNTTAAGSIKLIDGISGSTANIGTMKASIAEGTYIYDCVFAAGLRIVTAGSSDITVCYTQP